MGRASLFVVLPLLFLATGCSKDFGQAPKPPSLSDWAGPDGGFVALGPTDDPASTPLLIEMSDEAWELRYGQDWRDAQALDAFDVEVAGDGYMVDGAVIMPAGMEVGDVAGGAEVVADGEHETWYGTFPDTRTVSIRDGEFRGTAVFAPDVGPIRLSFQADEWELVYYE